MQTITATPEKKAPPVVKATGKPKAVKPVKAKAKPTAVPKPAKPVKGSARNQYKYTGKGSECKTPQMEALIETVNDAKKSELNQDSFTAQDLVALAVKEGNLSTRQDPLRIFRFYQKRLVDEGYFVKL